MEYMQADMFMLLAVCVNVYTALFINIFAGTAAIIMGSYCLTASLLYIKNEDRIVGQTLWDTPLFPV